MFGPFKDNEDGKGLRTGPVSSDRWKLYLIVSETLPSLLSTLNPPANRCPQHTRVTL